MGLKRERKENWGTQRDVNIGEGGSLTVGAYRTNTNSSKRKKGREEVIRGHWCF